MWTLHEILEVVNSAKMYRAIDDLKYYIEVYDTDDKFFWVENEDLEGALIEMRSKLGI